MYKKVLFFSMLGILFLACKKNDVDDPVITPETGKIQILFDHTVNDEPVEFEVLKYTNEAENPYMLTEIMYFISDVKFHSSTGKVISINKWKSNHYIDLAIPSTLKWEIYDDIPVGTYDSISFTFGFNEVDNRSFLFVNPPEVNMFWPEILGGGFHYMMINGRWKTPTDILKPFNFHLGIGQIYSGQTAHTDSIVGYVHNHFRVSLPLANFKIEKSQMKSVNLEMKLENWFSNPHAFDFNYWGGDIMQKQPAMLQAKENGWNVFIIKN